MVKGLTWPTYRNRQPEAFVGEGHNLWYRLQDELPRFRGGHTTRIRYQIIWLTERRKRIMRLIALRGIQQASDFLGISEVVMQSWRKGGAMSFKLLKELQDDLPTLKGDEANQRRTMRNWLTANHVRIHRVLQEQDNVADFLGISQRLFDNWIAVHPIEFQCLVCGTIHADMKDFWACLREHGVIQ